MDEREKLIETIADEDIVRYFYLDLPTEKVLDVMDAQTLRITSSQDEVPFNAQVKGYIGAVDSGGDPWILKPALDAKEALYHRICALAFLLDHWMGTISAPTTVFRIDGKLYRAAKVVRRAVQISSYNYLEHPYIDLLRADLVNRWLYFDEDRNPNNYLVIHNKRDHPFLVAIDFDKADLEAESMKIVGMQDKFGWIRGEKTRFLTLLRPDNFEGVPLETFEVRLSALSAIPEEAVRRIALALVSGYCQNPEELASRLVSNFLMRRAYIVEYFRRMFKPESETRNVSNAEEYSMFGASFLAMNRNKK
ncbi:MAG TPA: hypothetical protein DIC34_02220 [Treponema sp.]|nr:MAG: hypothetical protein A2Y36_11505 [Treponema sp. GWA1_62_8]OHE70082.1 MAG: hypothetical protein A2001_09195 [Treponema sp. GWC1_61_84]OHE71116.1 MAG: hypothetical protein A2413_11770 [Treponema sp. RIFOXYC1_FULL_61_9]HCM25359.1 hypothetical protein [Treponema sp.]